MGAHTILYSSWLPDPCGGADMRDAIRGELAFHGYSLEAPQSDPLDVSRCQSEECERLQHCLTNPSIAGAILMLIGDRRATDLAREVVESGKPVVFVDRLPGNAHDFDWVGIDNVDAAYQVVEHLILLGHRSIAHITNQETASTVADRHLGYRQALAVAGIPYRPELVVSHDNDWRGIAVSEATLRGLLDLPDPPTAVFAVHDWAAIFTMSTAHRLGLRMPGDLAVAGIDGVERFTHPRSLVTTAEVPFRRIGALAARRLVQRIEQGVLTDSPRVYHQIVEAPLRRYYSTWTRTDSAGASLMDESAWRQRIVFHFMHAHLAEDLTIERLAEYAGVSPRTLFQDFDRCGFDTPMAELRRLRLGQFHWGYWA